MVDCRDGRHEFDSLEHELDCLNLEDQLDHDECPRLSAEPDQEHSNVEL